MLRFSIQPNSRNRCRSAASHGLYAAGLLPSMPIIGNLPAVCSRPANGHAAAPPTSMMNERRFS
jgi:hypothetical protein